ncbi:MAG TPA: IclR family transcriptional regulator [Acidimicrobiales bacterium]|nr:IclR family transcriptional regulator [Acidimicrobiales bacterium]
MEPTVSGVGVLDKSMAVLAAVEGGASSLAELVAATGYSRATTHRLASALEAHGLLVRPARGGWVLGWRLIGLGQVASARQPLVAAAREPLERLRDATGESVQLYVRDGENRVCVASLESPHGLRTIVPVGAVHPLDRGSAGKVLADDPLVRKRGWADSVAEREPGVASVSAPVRDGRGRPVAAISVSGPIERTTRQPGRKYAADVVDAARQVEAGAHLADR